MANHVDIAVDRFGVAVAMRIQKSELRLAYPNAHGRRRGGRAVGPRAQRGAEDQRRQGNDAKIWHYISFLHILDDGYMDEGRTPHRRTFFRYRS
jgi:hypothetical protein